MLGQVPPLLLLLSGRVLSTEQWNLLGGGVPGTNWQLDWGRKLQLCVMSREFPLGNIFLGASAGLSLHVEHVALMVHLVMYRGERSDGGK